jgi:hypothetical protein
MLLVALALATTASIAAPAGATLPSAADALAFGKRWQAGATDEAKLVAAMPPPVWFGVDVSDRDYLNDHCEAWGNRHRLTPAAHAAPLAACVSRVMAARTTDAIAVAPLARAARRLPRAARDQLRSLEKTHRFVTITHAATSEDPDRFDAVLAVTAAEGAPRLTAMFVRIQIHSMDGE